MARKNYARRRWVAVILVLILSAIIALVWLVIQSLTASEEAQREEDQKQLVDNTSAAARFTDTVHSGGDGFAGYALEREAGKKLKSRTVEGKRIQDKWYEDDASDPDKIDYVARLRRLQDGTLHRAVFTIDALVQASSEIGANPAVITRILDLSLGADGMVGFSSEFPSLEALKEPGTRVAFIPGTPSETLLRALEADRMVTLTGDWRIELDSMQEVLQLMEEGRDKLGSGGLRTVYMLWEPFLSQALAQPGVKKLVDSTRRPGLITDVEVWSRQYLRDQPDMPRIMAQNAFRFLFRNRDRLADVVMTDDPTIKSAQAKAVVDGISWRNTQENYRHFGIVSAGNVPHIADLIEDVVRVLTTTGAISSDPTGGQPHKLYNDEVLKAMFEADFHPGNEDVTGEQPLRALSDEEWSRLMPVTRMQRTEDVKFGRGSRLTPEAKTALDSLAGLLKKWPAYYIEVKASIPKRGEREANVERAESRAKVVLEHLTTRGIQPARIRSASFEPPRATRAVVTFQLYQSSF